MFVKTDVEANNNKFWEITIDAAGTVSTRNGRVGSAGQKRTLGQGEKLVESKIREKLRGSYKEIEIVGAPETGGAIGSSELRSAAEDQIGRGDPVVTDLVRSLVAINRHQLLAATGGQMDLDLSSGIISTPVGVVTQANVERARALLAELEPFVVSQNFDAGSFRSTLQDYLMLVPQKVGASRGWHRSFLPDPDALSRQGALLDQLESSISIARDRIRDAANLDGKPGSAAASIFDVSLRLSEDAALLERVATFYRDGSSVSHMASKFRIGRVFDVSLGAMDREFERDGRKTGGIRQLWHGTRAHNLLSILKSGLIIPKSGGSIHVTGRMFGNGIYFSDQSTKSLNYSAGFWDGSAGSERRCYMFLADVAMGKPWHPDRTGSGLRPAAGHDSIFAKGGDLVRNNEMIVFRAGQVRLSHLVEFNI
ncbi:WGR domain-containing protein [Paracoccus sp. ME4]|uniref:WGR domain-containing protein n=1 Tax=Paracoccus sp. ME4 TaxID=3138066 RepID=UPI00398BA143